MASMGRSLSNIDQRSAERATTRSKLRSGASRVVSPPNHHMQQRQSRAKYPSRGTVSQRKLRFVMMFSSMTLLFSCIVGRKLRRLNCRAMLSILYLRNRKHFPCFYRVIETRVEVWENEKCCGNTSRRQMFLQLFRVLPNFHECFYNSIETRRKCFLFLLAK